MPARDDIRALIEQHLAQGPQPQDQGGTRVGGLVPEPTPWQQLTRAGGTVPARLGGETAPAAPITPFGMIAAKPGREQDAPMGEFAGGQAGIADIFAQVLGQDPESAMGPVDTEEARTAARQAAAPITSLAEEAVPLQSPEAGRQAELAEMLTTEVALAPLGAGLGGKKPPGKVATGVPTRGRTRRMQRGELKSMKDRVRERVRQEMADPEGRPIGKDVEVPDRIVEQEVRTERLNQAMMSERSAAGLGSKPYEGYIVPGEKALPHGASYREGIGGVDLPEGGFESRPSRITTGAANRKAMSATERKRQVGHEVGHGNVHQLSNQGDATARWRANKHSTRDTVHNLAQSKKLKDFAGEMEGRPSGPKNLDDYITMRMHEANQVDSTMALRQLKELRDLLKQNRRFEQSDLSTVNTWKHGTDDTLKRRMKGQLEMLGRVEREMAEEHAGGGVAGDAGRQLKALDDASERQLYRPGKTGLGRLQHGADEGLADLLQQMSQTPETLTPSARKILIDAGFELPDMSVFEEMGLHLQE